MFVTDNRSHHLLEQVVQRLDKTIGLLDLIANPPMTVTLPTIEAEPLFEERYVPKAGGHDPHR